MIGDLTPLSGKKLDELNVPNCKNIRDITALRGIPLQRLDLSRTAIRDLVPLAGSTIRELNLEGCIDLTDLGPLADMPQLEAVIVPAQCKDIEFLRTHASLRRLSYKKMTQPVYEFWQEFDAKKDAPAGPPAARAAGTGARPGGARPPTAGPPGGWRSGGAGP